MSCSLSNRTRELRVNLFVFFVEVYPAFAVRSNCNKIFYRNPADVTMEISLGEQIISKNRIKISQLGNIMMIPINKMKLVFDTNTGQLLSIMND